ncbi:RCC1 domain-containing protein [Corallococcus sp. M7]
MSLSVRGLAVLSVLAFVAAGCKESSGPAVDVFTSLQLEAPDEDVASVQVTVSGPDMDARTVTLTKQAGRWSGVIDAVPVGGGHTFAGAALDGSGARLHEATVSDVALTEEAGSAAVYLLLPSSQTSSDVPVVTSLVASPGTLTGGKPVSLKAAVRGTGAGSAPVAAWTSATGGSFSDAGSLQTTWTASRTENPALTLTLTEGKGASHALTVKLPVQNVRPLSEALFNVSPRVASAQATPEASVKDGAALSVTSVDPEGEALTYAWKASCVGVFEDPATATTRFLPTAQLPVVNCKPCDLTVTVTDPHGGQAQETVSTCVKPGPAAPTRLAEDNGHSLAIRPDGTVWAWGNNSQGQLGTGSTATSEPVPAQVPGLTDIVAVAAGSVHSFALRSDGTLFGWGGNDYGQLADEDRTLVRRTPAVVEGLPRIAAITTRNIYSLALGMDGTVWGWGNGKARPAEVALPPGISAISLEINDGLALHQMGTLFTWRLGFSGAPTEPTRLGTLSDILTISSGYNRSLALGADGAVYSWGLDPATNSRTEPQRMASLPRAAAIGSGGLVEDASAVLLEDGSVIWWSRLFPDLVRVASLPAMSRLGQGACLAQRADGAVFSWCNSNGGAVQVLSRPAAER